MFLWADPNCSCSYSNLYGNPPKVIAQTNVVSSGEKNLLAIFWRRGGDYLGVEYMLYPISDQLSLTSQINNNCWQAPR